MTTPNADVIYAMTDLDLKKDGPLVVAAPPGLLGMFTDSWRRFTDESAIRAHIDKSRRVSPRGEREGQSSGKNTAEGRTLRTCRRAVQTT